MPLQRYSQTAAVIGLSVLLVATGSAVVEAQQQDDANGVTVSPSASTEAAANETYWTPERLRDAEPLDLPSPGEPGPQGMPEGTELVPPSMTQEAGRVDEGDGGAPPTVDPGDSLAKPIAYAPDRAEAGPAGPGTEATSSFGAHFTTRLVPASVEREYPYRTVGKLFFRDPRTGNNSVCSAAVLRPRVVATAGHCVTNPSTNPQDRYFFVNFLFVPAFNNGQAPFGTWTSNQQWVSNNWHFSDGSVPNRGDMAMLIIRDQPVRGQTRRIGEVTGWLGWRSNALGRNHVTMLGYPCNLESCRRMIETGAGTFAAGGENTFIYGSSSRGGHSGGPFVQDFGSAPAGSPQGSSGLNRLVGITSYGPVATEPKYLGASNFGENFTNLLNAACTAASGNC